MSTVALSGNDVVIINNINITDFADGTIAELTFPNDIMTVKTGKNGNSIYGINETGRQCDLKLRVIRGSSNDISLNGLLAAQQLLGAQFPLMTGQLIKKMGDGQGNLASDTYILGGGVFQKAVEAKSSVEGDSEQSVSIYMMKFSNAPRAIR